MNEVINKTELFLFDMDGTLYLGNKLFDFTKELLKTIKSKGKKYLFMTNNSSKSVDDYINKLKYMGILATYDDFITSSQATAYYILKNYPKTKFYVCGTNSLKKELNEKGIILTENTLDAEGVIIGFDTELTFKKLEDVCKILTNKNVIYIATNPDYVCPTEYGSVPDCGSFCDMIFNATKKRPFVIGKPSPLMIDLAIDKKGTSKSKTLVIGDRIYTDIKCGLNAGVTTLLVMSGETDCETLNNSDIKPHYVLESGQGILDILK